MTNTQKQIAYQAVKSTGLQTHIY